jgi:hypothetical protein
MTDKYPHKLQFCDAGRKQFERIAVLLDLDDWNQAIGFSAVFTLQFAEQHVKGRTEVAYITPELKKLLTSDVLSELAERTGQSKAEVLRNALNIYYRVVTLPEQDLLLIRSVIDDCEKKQGIGWPDD